MQWFINWVKSIFAMFFGRSAQHRYTRRLESKLKGATVSKLQGKLHKKRAEIDKKVFKGQDKLFGPRKKRKTAPPKR